MKGIYFFGHNMLSYLHRIYFLGNLVRFIKAFLIYLFIKGSFLALVYFCFKGATLSGASLQTFINELKEVSLEVCKFPFYCINIRSKFII